MELPVSVIVAVAMLGPRSSCGQVELITPGVPRDAYGGGSGAGLAIARRLAERQGGELWLESSVPGEGSVFSFTVPGA